MKRYTNYNTDYAYDYGRDNRDGYADDYIEFVEQWKKDREKKNEQTPQE